MNNAITNKAESMNKDVAAQMDPQAIPMQPTPVAPVPDPTMQVAAVDPTMNPYSNGTGSARPNIPQVDANNLNQFNQGVSMSKNYGHGPSKKNKKPALDPMAFLSVLSPK